MAQGILNDLGKKYKVNIRGNSAGIFATENGPISEKAIEAMKKINVDISNYNSKSLNSINLNNMDLILVMGKNHKNFIIDKYPNTIGRIFLLNEYAFNKNKDIEDPFGGSLMEYEIARDEIYMAIKEIIRREKHDNWNS